MDAFGNAVGNAIVAGRVQEHSEDVKRESDIAAFSRASYASGSGEVAKNIGSNVATTQFIRGVERRSEDMSGGAASRKITKQAAENINTQMQKDMVNFVDTQQRQITNDTQARFAQDAVANKNANQALMQNSQGYQQETALLESERIALSQQHKDIRAANKVAAQNRYNNMQTFKLKGAGGIDFANDVDWLEIGAFEEAAWADGRRRAEAWNEFSLYDTVEAGLDYYNGAEQLETVKIGGSIEGQVVKNVFNLGLGFALSNDGKIGVGRSIEIGASINTNAISLGLELDYTKGYNVNSDELLNGYADIDSLEWDAVETGLKAAQVPKIGRYIARLRPITAGGGIEKGDLYSFNPISNKHGNEPIGTSKSITASVTAGWSFNDDNPTKGHTKFIPNYDKTLSHDRGYTLDLGLVGKFAYAVFNTPSKFISAFEGN